MGQVRKGVFKISYNNKDITADISAHVISVDYTDNTEGKTDEVEIIVQDRDELWSNDWYPTKGAKIDLSFGYDDILVVAGTFEIDEIELNTPPDTISMKALAVPLSGKLRTKKSYAHEKKTLKEIATAVADANGLTVKGKIEDIQFDRITQDRETDLGFLYRISSMFGYVFSIRGTVMTFTNIFDIEKADPVLSIDKSECSNIKITDKISNSFGSATVSYHNPVKKEVVNYTIQQKANADDVKFNYIQAGDAIEIRHKVENTQQAEAAAKASLHRANSLQQSGNFSIDGRPQLLSGNNFEFTGIGQVSGVYHVICSKHKIDREGGYITDCDIKRVGFVTLTKHKTAKKRKPPKYDVKVTK